MHTLTLRLLGEPGRGLLSKPALARGCQLCFAGSKAVIFITGVCDDNCYYCPVSREKLGRRLLYVNEEPVPSVEEIPLEIARSGATGASITGGDPLIAVDLVVEAVRLLKEHFGAGFHIHLYTSGRYASPEILALLDTAGLDEIRFHPTRLEFLERAAWAKRNTSMSVGVEIPVGPGLEEWARKVIEEADRLGLDFVNLNELEFVEPNARALLARGLRESPSRPFTVEGSLESAIRIVEWASENVGIPVHFCPASFKDSIQTRNRFRRTAHTDMGWNEEPTPHGTLTVYAGEKVFEAHPTRSRLPVAGSRVESARN